MEEITERIKQALAKEEGQAERFASIVRLFLLLIFTLVAILNFQAVSIGANAINFGALLIALSYGLIVFFRLQLGSYHPAMKYITSCIDILLVYLVLFMYSRIQIPSVALKNYVFLAVFPILALTVLRYDPKLTWTAGSVAILLYIGLFLSVLPSIRIIPGGYKEELFTEAVTYIGQLTKLFILIGFVLLAAYMARYTRDLIEKLVHREVKLETEKESMERDLEIAARVQNELLPRSFPAPEGLEVYGKLLPGKFVGGDYYDFLQLSEHSVLLVVADVSGKGVPAGLIMSEVRASTHLLASMKMKLEELVRELNGLLYRSTSPETFVTYLAAEIDAANHLVRYVNAGHSPLVCHSGAGMRLLPLRTIPLGCFRELPSFSVCSERFSSGATFIAYTDGVVERTNASLEEYGSERLFKFIKENVHLNPERLVSALLEQVKSFGGEKPLDDDVTVAVARVL